MSATSQVSMAGIVSVLTWAILNGIIVSLCVTGVIALGRFVYRRFRRGRFKTVFGLKAREFYLVYAALEVHPMVLSAVNKINPKLAHFPLAKPGRPDMAFSAKKVVSSCEIRAVTYLESTFAKNAGIAAHSVADDSIVGRLDLDFVSLGATSNLKTVDVFGNAANTLADYDFVSGSFILKANGQPVCNPRAGFDHGILLKIHPVQFPQRTWIACAGLGEWGTSGTSWFLANKWNEIARKVKEGPFLCVIEVRPGQDESASLISMHV